MKKRINDLLNGKFENLQNTLELSQNEIVDDTMENENYCGKFSVLGTQQKPVQGFILSTNPRIGLRPDNFSGIGETIRYEADVTGLEPGDILKGEFLLNTTAGEYHLPYEIHIQGKAQEKHKAQTAELTPEEFAALAKEDFAKAYVLFLSASFGKMIQKWGVHSKMLYDGILAGGTSYRCLEQFLVGMKLKESISFTLEEEHILLDHMTETRKEELVIRKNTWGFETLDITCDAGFLTIEKPQITTEEFLGSVCHVGFMVHKEKLHAGRQFARILINTGREELCCLVEVNNSEKESSIQPFYCRKKEAARLLSLYIDYRTGTTEEADWAKESLHALDRYRRNGGCHIGYDLYESYILFQIEDTIHAELLLGQIQQRKDELKDGQWKACYLYLTSIQNKEEEYQEYVQKEIQNLYLENQESWILLWLMLRINGQMYRNDTEKLEEIRRKYQQKVVTPALYLDAWDILKKEPLMLRRMEEFEIHLLAFLCRHGIFDREISGQTAQLAQRMNGFHPVLFRVLTACYHAGPTRNLLTAICKMLIDGRKSDKKYASWFTLGVMQDIRITGLYEYFVETADHLEMEKLPKSIRLYFVYHNTLDYTRKAAIYAAIIRNRSQDEETYISYRKVMELFMEEQLTEGRINEDLAVLYEDLLTEEVMTQQLAAGLEKVLFTCEIRCSEKAFRQLTVIHRALKKEQKAMLTEQKAQVQIVTPDVLLLAEDKEGRLYAAEGFCTQKRYLTSVRLEELCRKYNDKPNRFLIHDCVREGQVFNETQTQDYLLLLKLPELKESYRQELQKQLLIYFAQNPSDAVAEKFLQNIDIQEMARQNMKETATLLAGQGKYRELYQLICVYGMEKVELNILVRMCSFLLTEDADREEDKMLLAVCEYCFRKNLYDEKMLAFLMKYYEGSLAEMKQIWYAGQTFHLESYELEEKILVLLLYVQQGSEDTEPIFASYEKKMGKSRISRAYVTWMAYESFVREKHVDWCVFSYMERNMLGIVGTPDICKLALLKRYTERKEKSAGQQKWMLYLLEKYLDAGMRFAFMLKLPKKLKVQYHLQDKMIIEYRSTPGRKVILHYSRQGETEKSVLMKEAFEGIYTKEFTVFYKDTLEWYVTEESETGSKEIQKQSCTCTTLPGHHGVSAYDLINQMIAAREKGDLEQLKTLMEQYRQQEYLATTMFGLN